DFRLPTSDFFNNTNLIRLGTNVTVVEKQVVENVIAIGGSAIVQPNGRVTQLGDGLHEGAIASAFEVAQLISSPLALSKLLIHNS
ncbi:MAG: hypothetical protein ACYTXE_25895, partial [Nostoc sp.]